MGAASNFGRDELGINSPTHRNTHAEGDLFNLNATSIAATSTSDKNELIDDLFKTCATTNPAPTSSTDTNGQKESNALESDFNPRADEVQEFGDFASAFGSSSEPTSLNATNTPVVAKKDDFADFSSVFEGAQAAKNVVNADNLLFVEDSPAIDRSVATNSSQPVGDLLSDLHGLNLNTPIPSGE